MTCPFAAVQLAGSTCHCCAAACTSMARALAPALRSGFQNARIEVGIAGGLEAEGGIAVELVVRRRMLERHLREIGVELLGEDHRNRGVDALAHLDLRHDQRGLAGLVDADEGVGRELAVGRVGRLHRLVAPRASGKMESEQESAGQAAGQQMRGAKAVRRSFSATVMIASYD